VAGLPRPHHPRPRRGSTTVHDTDAMIPAGARQPGHARERTILLKTLAAICGTSTPPLTHARLIDAVAVNVWNRELVECGAPYLVAVREKNAETRTPGLSKPATLLNLDPGH